MSMVAFFSAVTNVSGEIWGFNESVSEGCPTYSF